VVRTACNWLCSKVCSDSASVAAITEAGGVPSLVLLLSSGPNTQTAAAHVLWRMVVPANPGGLPAEEEKQLRAAQQRAKEAMVEVGAWELGAGVLLECRCCCRMALNPAAGCGAVALLDVPAPCPCTLSPHRPPLPSRTYMPCCPSRSLAWSVPGAQHHRPATRTSQST
jgi:hypothetical protein